MSLSVVFYTSNGNVQLSTNDINISANLLNEVVKHPNIIFPIEPDNYYSVIILHDDIIKLFIINISLEDRSGTLLLYDNNYVPGSYQIRLYKQLSYLDNDISINSRDFQMYGIDELFQKLQKSQPIHILNFHVTHL